MSGFWLFARRFAEAAFFGALGGLVLLLLAPVVLGWRPYTVLTGSMRPGIQPGDVVMDRPVQASTVQVGQIVTFSDPTRGGALVTHRVRSIKPTGRSMDVETRGDANNASERWTIDAKDPVGLVVYVVPRVGYVAKLIRNPVGLLVLVVLPVLLLAFTTLRKIWAEDDSGDDDAPPSGDGPERSAPAEPKTRLQADPAAHVAEAAALAHLARTDAHAPV